MESFVMRIERCDVGTVTVVFQEQEGVATALLVIDGQSIYGW